jgi:chaperonin cofactor prefoldin
MQIQPQEYLQKKVEFYEVQCNQYLQERVSLQAQLHLVLIEIEKLEARIKEFESEENEVVDVNSNTNT